VLVDTLSAAGAVEMIEGAELPVPEALATAAQTGEPKRFFHHNSINTGRFFVAG
jgi:hypothetical protein